MFFKSGIFFSKSKKHVKHDSLLCSYLVLRFFFLWDCRAVWKLVLGLFKWIGGARFRFFSLKKKKKKDIEIITSCCNFSTFRIQTQLQICAELYIHVFSTIQDQNCLISDDSYREIPSDYYYFSSSWALFCTCIQMPFYMGCCIYILGQAFSTWSYFFCCCLFDLVFLTPLFVSMSVTFPSQAKG